MKKEYTIGLDIGTNSVGYSVVVDGFNVPSKNMKVLGNTDVKKVKKNLMGALLFDSASTAESRRLKRNTRRRYTRRKNRIVELQNIFESEINKIDSNFFHRLKESFYVSEDKKNEKHPVFGNKQDEVNYHNQFPTIYHLRKHLADSTEKADLRLVYLALSHIIKFRGNFLYDVDFDVENISIFENYNRFIQEYNELFNKNEDGEFINPINTNIDPTEIFRQKISKSKKVENLLSKYEGEKNNGKLSQFIKLIVGNQGKFKDVFNSEDDLKLQIPDENYEINLEEILSKIGNEYADIFAMAQSVYTSIILSDILDSKIVSKAKLSSIMINRYKEHKMDLKKLKRFILDNSDKKTYDKVFKDIKGGYYKSYIDDSLKEVDFYKNMKRLLIEIDGSEYFINKIDKEDFLRKQRTFDNGVIPNQLHKKEMCAIIKNQQKYYPFLKDNYDNLIKILEFRIPYYIGPLEKNGNNKFAWIQRKKDEKITPYNFNEVVDLEASATQFIEKMTSFDTYLPNEKVLPKNSIIYQKFMIFNELTKVSYSKENGRKTYFDKETKLDIFEKLFKRYRKVTKKQLIEYLENEKGIFNVKINGIESSFNASFSTYLDLAKINGMKEILDESRNTYKVEEIIKLITLFEDKEMKYNQLKKFNDLINNSIIKELSRKKYKGWGNLSIKLIDGILSKENGESRTILDYLISDKHNRNFMQLISDETLQFRERIEKENIIDESKSLHEIIYSLAGSPSIKKGILQSINIVEEIIRVMGYYPKNIVVEMSRENQTTQKGRNQSKARLEKIESGIKELGSLILKENPIIDNSKLKNNHLFLYYLQNGKDIYTGKSINIDELSKYDIDHVIPQSFIDDDSIDNTVLTFSSKNRGKSDNVPSIDVVNKMKGEWELLKNAGLMSERKFSNLTKALRGGINEADKYGFINRQLVETRQITKHVANLLNQRFNSEEEKVKIITLKSAMVSQFRKNFGLYKVREINYYHHAHDAYLNAVVANLLINTYPKLEKYFVYGSFKKIKFNGEEKATIRKDFNENLINNFMFNSLITNNDTGEVIWNKENNLAKIKKVLGYHNVNIVKKVEEQKGGFSKETILPKGNSDKLIPRKKGWDPKKYGGFDSQVVAYSLAVTYIENNKLIKKVIPINIMDKKNYEENNCNYLHNLGIYDVKSVIKLPKYSLFMFDDGRKRFLASDKELQKGNSFVIPNDYLELIYNSIKYEKLKDNKLLEYLEKNRYKFENLLYLIIEFSKSYILALENDKKIISLFEENKNKDIIEIAKSFIELLNYTYIGAPAAFKFFGVLIDRKRYTSTTEIWNSIYICQSCTGLYETRIDMRK